MSLKSLVRLTSKLIMDVEEAVDMTEINKGVDSSFLRRGSDQKWT